MAGIQYGDQLGGEFGPPAIGLGEIDHIRIADGALIDAVLLEYLIDHCFKVAGTAIVGCSGLYFRRSIRVVGITAFLHTSAIWVVMAVSICSLLAWSFNCGHCSNAWRQLLI